jgi:abhydrolase domain-containing protein 17
MMVAAETYWWRLLGIAGVVVVLGYLVVATSACSMVGSVLYYPNYGSRHAPAGLQKIRSGTDEIAVLHLPNPNARFTVWFFHGNAEALGDLEPFLITLRDRGYSVFAFDYPGYGVSTGKPSEQSLYAAARAVGAHLRDVLHVPADRTIIFGRSLGGGPAMQMAAEDKPAGLILQSTFVSVFRVVTRWPLLPFDQFENLKKISRVRCPVLVMHGQSDEVIPFRHGEALLAAANEPKRALWVAGATHNDFVAVAGSRFWNALREFSDVCGRPSGSSP